MAQTIDVQKRLLQLGYKLPKFGADGVAGSETADALRLFQRDKGIPITGRIDAPTIAELFPEGDDQTQSPVVVPSNWMPTAAMQRIIVHWTAGAHKATTFDKSHYHILIEGDGTVIRGTPTIDLNQSPVRGRYAAHTLNCNSGSIGVSLCCMAGARESPFNAGPAPMTRAQWDKLPHVLAALCERYSINVTPKTVLSHAEVQANLGIVQRGKWDIARLAFDPSVSGAKACGDIFRTKTLELM